MKSQLTQDIVRELLDYNPRTGLFTWKYRDLKWFDPNGWNGGGTRGNLRSQCSWNGKHAGQQAFCTPRLWEGYDRTNIYLWGCILYENHPGHRMAFMWMEGRWPDPEVDHRDGDGTNNRWRNLFETDRSGNQHNRRRARSFKKQPLLHKHQGIKVQEWNGRFGARITHAGQNIWLGTYDTLDEAIAVRKKAERKYGFTARHGSPS